ncbi:MAG: InlB B-repeat-containing protein, partial [Balneolaceae bacterium]
MAKIYYSIIILSLFIISSCAPGSPPSESVILYKVNITAEPNEAGTVSPDSLEVDEGEEIEITASPNENWIFDSWQGDHNGNTNPATIMVDSDKTISALFIKREYPLTISVEGEGTVSERVLQNKTTDYPQGTTVELTANPSTGWVFSHWVGDVDTDGNPLEIVVEEAQEVTAVFVIREFNLEINIEGEGTVSEQVVEDDSTAIELTANPADGWTFVEWNGDVSGSDNPVQITMDETKEVTAVFERRDYPLTVNIEGEGTVTEEVIQARTTEYAYGTTVELTANPADGWTFTGWSGDLSGSENPTQIDITEEKEVTAVFQEEKDFYALTIETEGEGSVSTELESGDESDGLYENGSVVELTASVADEWVFSHWEGSVDGDENPVSVEMNSDKTISAVFVPREYPLTVNIEGEGTVTEEVIQPRTTDYPSGTIVQITATPANGWTFSHWDDDLTGGENPVEIEITEATEVTAIFERDFFDLTTQTDGNGSVTETLQSGNESSGEYEYESVVELSAAPDEGWSFIEWEGDLDESTNPQTITIDSDKNITAVFREDEVEIELFTLTINTGGNGSGATSPESGEYDEGTEIQLTATPNEGSSFSHWEGEEIDGEENLQVTIEMDSDKEVTAIFEEDEVEIEQFTLTINTDGNGAFTPESGSVFDEDSDVELTATPDDGWTFSHWQGEEIDGTENSETTITMDSNKTVTAVFEEVIEQFTLIINTDGNGTFTPESGSVFDEDSDVELT